MEWLAPQVALAVNGPPNLALGQEGTYAITVTGSGTSWQVDNIQLSSTGQF